MTHPMNNNPKAVIYCRVSTKEQVEEGNSLVTQERLCRVYAAKHGYEVSEIFIEQGESAKTADRTELKRLLAFCAVKSNAVSAVLAYKIDRIARNTDDYAQIRIILKRVGVEIKSISEHFENTPTGRFMENIIANVAQFDNDVRTERSIGGMKEAVREGRYVWRAPFGYQNCKIGGKSSIIPNNKAMLVSKAFAEVAKNYTTIANIRRALIEEGLVSEKNIPLSFNQFTRMLRNELYAGWIIKFKERHKGVFPNIVSQELFDHVQRVLNQKRQRNRSYCSNNPDFPLRKFFIHPTGKRLTGCWCTGKNKKNRFAYYFYRIPGLHFRRDTVEAIFEEYLNGFEFSPQLVLKLRMALISGVHARGKTKNESVEVVQQKIDELKKKQKFLIEKTMSGVISDTVLKEQLSEIETAILDLSITQINTEQTEEVDIPKLLMDVAKFLKTPGTYWRNASYAIKSSLQVFYFPNGVIFDGTNCQTPETCRLFKLKSEFSDENSSKVPSGKSFSNTPDIVKFPHHTLTNLEINQCITELQVLSDINKTRSDRKSH